MTNGSNDRLDSIDRRLEQLVAVTERQAETAAAQAENIRNQTENVRSLVSAVSELARSTTELSRDRRTLLDAATRSAQASESASFMAQRTLEAMRDLIEELRNRP